MDIKSSLSKISISSQSDATNKSSNQEPVRNLPPSSNGRASEKAAKTNENGNSPVAVNAEKLHVLFDKDSNIVQAIVSEQSSENIVRKFPSDEYLELIALIDGTFNNKA